MLTRAITKTRIASASKPEQIETRSHARSAGDRQEILSQTRSSRPGPGPAEKAMNRRMGNSGANDENLKRGPPPYRSHSYRREKAEKHHCRKEPAGRGEQDVCCTPTAGLIGADAIHQRGPRRALKCSILEVPGKERLSEAQNQ